MVTANKTLVRTSQINSKKNHRNLGGFFYSFATNTKYGIRSSHESVLLQFALRSLLHLYERCQQLPTY